MSARSPGSLAVVIAMLRNGIWQWFVLRAARHDHGPWRRELNAIVRPPAAESSLRE